MSKIHRQRPQPRYRSSHPQGYIPSPKLTWTERIGINIPSDQLISHAKAPGSALPCDPRNPHLRLHKVLDMLLSGINRQREGSSTKKAGTSATAAPWEILVARVDLPLHSRLLPGFSPNGRAIVDNVMLLWRLPYATANNRSSIFGSCSKELWRPCFYGVIGKRCPRLWFFQVSSNESQSIC